MQQLSNSARPRGFLSRILLLLTGGNSFARLSSIGGLFCRPSGDAVPHAADHARAGIERPSQRRSWGSVTAIIVGWVLVCAGAIVAGPVLAPQVAEATVPGSPGVPQAPTNLLTETFENNTGATPVLLTSYTGAAPASAQYTAAPAWLTNCNGSILQWGATPQSASSCVQAMSFNRAQNLAWAMGKFHGGDGTDDHVVAAYTEAAISPAGQVEFQTLNDIPLPTATGRYITFSVDTAALNCATSAAPLYQFSLLVGGTATPIGGQLNACSSTTNINTPSGLPARVGTYTSNGSILFAGSAVGLRMTNQQSNANGNDAAIDNIRILDVTPQLDKSFSPQTVDVNGSSTLTLTVTNTSELAAKNGWSFTDNLPAGLTITGPAATTTCPNGTVTAPTGAAKIVTNGDLSAGMASCAITVHVTSDTAGTFSNGPGNINPSIGLTPPGDSSVTFIKPPSWSCDAFGYLFQSPNASTHSVTKIDLATGAATSVGSTSSDVNAVGYNVLDNYFYGYSQTLNGIVRVNGDLSLTFLGNPTGLGTTNYSIGDFDDAGHLFLTTNPAGTTAAWREVDLAPGSPTYGTVIGSGNMVTPAAYDNSTAADWSWIDGLFYRVVANPQGASALFSFDPTTGAVTNLGATGITFNGANGATYADATATSTSASTTAARSTGSTPPHRAHR